MTLDEMARQYDWTYTATRVGDDYTYIMTSEPQFAAGWWHYLARLDRTETPSARWAWHTISQRMHP